MRSLARRQDFEGAQKTKEDLELMDGFSLRSCISTRGRIDSDVIASCLLGREAFFVHLALSGGRVSKNGFFHLQTLRDSEDEALREFLIDFYRLRPLPGEIIVSRLPAQAEELAGFFPARRPTAPAVAGQFGPQRRGRRVRLHVPQRGKKKHVLDLALRNLALFVQKSDFRALGEEMQRTLNLRNFPARIEGFDISHLGESNRVGAQVVFKDGRPEKRMYRNYIIRAAAPGDTAAMEELLTRRFRAGSLPADLVLIDGGLPQLAVARRVRNDRGSDST